MNLIVANFFNCYEYQSHCCGVVLHIHISVLFYIYGPNT